MGLSGENTSVTRRLYRAPLVPAAALFIAGILAGRYAPLPVGVWIVLGIVGFIAGIAGLIRRDLFGIAAIGTGVTLLAIAAVETHQTYYSIPTDHIVTYSANSPILTTVRGQIVTIPQTIAADAVYDAPPQTRFVLAAYAIQTDTGFADVQGPLRVTIREADGRLRAGQKVELVGTLARLRGPANPGQFDWAAAGRREGLFNTFTVPAPDGVTILAGRDPSLIMRALWNARSAARRHIADCGDLEQGRLMNALIIGDRSPALASLNRTMVRAGVAHYLSISGLHLGVFLGFVYLLCRLLWLTPRRSAIIVLVVLAIYVLLADARAPLLRSAIMAVALCMGAIFRRRYVALNALAAAAMVLLLIDPLELFSPGFQLSFTIVAGIVVLYRPVRRFLFGRWLRRRGLMVFRSEQRARRWLHFTAADWAMGLITMCLTAYVVAAPMSAYHFGIFSPYGIILTPLLFPLLLAVLVPGYVSAALAWPMPNLSYAIGRLSAHAANTLANAVDALQRLPALSIELRPVSVVWVLLCYTAVLAVLFARRIPFGRTLTALVVLGLAVATIYSQRTTPPPEAGELNMLSVGSGQCAILRTPRGNVYLFDAGAQRQENLYERTISPFMRSQRYPRPAATFISHANADHYNALPELVRRASLRDVYVNGYFGREPPNEMGGSHAKTLIAKLQGDGATVVRLRAGERVELDADTYVEVLWPAAPPREDLSINDTSLVLRIECNGRSVLMTGDIEADAQAALLADPNRLRADVLVLPHHGGWEKTLPAFVAAVRPKVILRSNATEGFAPLTQTERAAFYADLRRGYRYYSTARNGWIQVRLNAGPLAVQTMR